MRKETKALRTEEHVEKPRVARYLAVCLDGAEAPGAVAPAAQGQELQVHQLRRAAGRPREQHALPVRRIAGVVHRVRDDVVTASKREGRYLIILINEGEKTNFRLTTVASKA